MSLHFMKGEVAEPLTSLLVLLIPPRGTPASLLHQPGTPLDLGPGGGIGTPTLRFMAATSATIPPD